MITNHSSYIESWSRKNEYKDDLRKVMAADELEHFNVLKYILIVLVNELKL